jgi:hypothetical protein
VRSRPPIDSCFNNPKSRTTDAQSFGRSHLDANLPVPRRRLYQASAYGLAMVLNQAFAGNEPLDCREQRVLNQRIVRRGEHRTNQVSFADRLQATGHMSLCLFDFRLGA